MAGRVVAWGDNGGGQTNVPPDLTNVVAIAGVAVFIALADGASADLWWSCGVLAFAVLEHINYYHYQLMYDTRGAFDYVRRNGRLRKAALGLDLRRHNAL